MYNRFEKIWQNNGICDFNFSDVSRHYELRDKGWGLVQGVGTGAGHEASPVSYRHNFLVENYFFLQIELFLFF